MNDQATSLRKKVEAKVKGNNKNKRTRIIAIASGKGGVGKTNITVNLGLALQELGKRVLLLDADLGMANIDILLGMTPKYNLSHVMKGKCRFEEALLEGPDGIHILPGTSGVEDLINISSLEVARLMGASSKIEENYDIVLIDIGAGVHSSVVNFIMACDEVIVVLTPEPTAIMDAYSLIKILSNHKYEKNINLLINQVNSRQEGNSVASRMQRVIKEYLSIDINILGDIPYDANVRQAIKEQGAFINLYPKSKAGKALKEIAGGMVEKSEEIESRGTKGFIYRVIGIFNRN